MSKIMYKDKQILGCISDSKYASYDNTGTGLSATNAQDAITELNGKLNQLTNNNIGTVTNLNSYTDANRFTVPADGYITIQFPTTKTVNNACVALYGENGESITSFGTVTNSNINANYQNIAVFAKKGMQCAIADRSANTTVYFKALT